MKKQVQTYLNYLSTLKPMEMSDEERKAEAAKMLIRIQFYQHERIIHLMVTLAFALMFILSVFVLVATKEIAFVALIIALLTLLVPYIMHYFFLENSVQAMYLVYYEMTK